ncbi:hypothetical protein K0B04_02550 [Patescibacteria group bacterium]|nr:hypothetical protein [Patescibacteria group bacterium]
MGETHENKTSDPGTFNKVFDWFLDELKEDSHPDIVINDEDFFQHHEEAQPDVSDKSKKYRGIIEKVTKD